MNLFFHGSLQLFVKIKFALPTASDKKYNLKLDFPKVVVEMGQYHSFEIDGASIFYYFSPQYRRYRYMGNVDIFKIQSINVLIIARCGIALPFHVNFVTRVQTRLQTPSLLYLGLRKTRLWYIMQLCKQNCVNNAFIMLKLYCCKILCHIRT